MGALGDDAWRVPATPAGPLPIRAALPANCAPRGADEASFDGAAFSAEWIARCPGGLEGGEIRVDGLERTETDVLLRLETTPGATETHRLTAAHTALAIPAPRGLAGTFAAYFLLGVAHIFEGADHLLFVFALVPLVPDRRHLVAVVTAFTLAHSLSLAAATLGWLVVPAPPVEAVVALSIMFLAAELARPPGAPPTLSRRWPALVAFAFGLLPGLGFARALLDIGLPKGEIPAALLAFNLGVEAGQLLFIALVLAAGACLARLYPATMAAARRPRSLGAAGYAISGVAAVWFVDRVAAF